MLIEKLRGKTKAVFGRSNCAQSVAILAGREDLAESFRPYGSGRAPEGRCGALHAALLLTDLKHHPRLVKEFTSIAGSDKCQEIKSIHQTPCHECVAQAAFLQYQYQKLD